MYPAEIKLFSPSREKIKKSKNPSFFVYNLPSQAADLPSQAADLPSQAANSRSTALAAVMLSLFPAANSRYTALAAAMLMLLIAINVAGFQPPVPCY